MLWGLPALLALTGALTQPDLCILERNQIKDLLQVSCVGKGLSRVPPELPEDTGILLLRSNHLAQVSTASFQHLHNLTDLDLSYNRMDGLKADDPLPNLQELVLSHNALKNLPILQGLPNLVRLALGHNALSQLPEGGFSALGRLADLELQGNQLRTLPSGAFRGLAALKDLDLSDNRLRVLPQELLAGLGALETLRLERNELRSVPEGFFPEGQFFQYIYLAENPWHCNCKLDYLRNWIKENEFSVYTRVQGPEKEITENEPESVKCQAPPEEVGRPVMQFETECRELGDEDGWEDNELSEPWAGLGPTTLGPTATPPAGSASPSPPSRGSLGTPTTLGPPATPPAGSASPSPPSRGSLGTPTTLGPTATPPAGSASPSPPSRGSLGTPTTLGPTATPPAGSASPSPPSRGSLDATVRTATAVRAPVTTGPRFTARFLMPAPPAPCQCPLLPGVALGLTRQQASPVPWESCLAVPCCLLRLGLYVTCLALVSLPTLAAVSCWCGWVCPGWHAQATRSALGSQLVRCQPLEQATLERGHVPREGCQPLPRPRFYYVCKRLEVRPFRHVTWLLISLPGPSGLWPWERKGSSPSCRLDRGKDHLRAVPVTYAAATL